MRRWKLALGVSVAVFATGVAVGYVATQRGVRQEEVPRWLVKGILRRLLPPQRP